MHLVLNNLFISFEIVFGSCNQLFLDLNNGFGILNDVLLAVNHASGSKLYFLVEIAFFRFKFCFLISESYFQL
jgi:hypothetical protein